MRAYSMDLRERVVGVVVAEGWSQARAAQVYGVSEPSVSRFVEAYRAGGDLTARRGGGGPRKLRLAEHQEALREHLQAEPDADLAARCERLAREEGVHVSVPTLWRAIRALGWTRKKRR
jgi:transposase